MPVLPLPSGPLDRPASLRRMADGELDVLVVGAGVTGCGVALDAAARGLRTGLVDAGDVGSGTSSMSSKLVHGGLRYLQGREYRLVAEALAERQRLVTNAPHLVAPLPFLIPLFSARRSLAGAFSSALWLYDLAGGLRIGHRHRRVDPATALAHQPALRTDTLVDSFLYWDAQADDARLTLALARTAAAHGAAVATYAPVEELTTSGGRVDGARLADGTRIRASVVINAGGVWAEQVAGLVDGPAEHVALRPAKGVHVTVRADRLPCDVATVLAAAGGRSVFVVPWDARLATRPAGPGRYTYVGTTDTDHHGDLASPHATAADVAYLLAAVNRWTTANLQPGDVTGTWAGLRPLVAGAAGAPGDGGAAGEEGATADLSRRHRVDVAASGLVTVTGGKLTTYRAMAADAVDAAGRVLGRRLPRCPTRSLALWGAAGWAELSAEGAAARLGVAPAALAHLAGRHGGQARAVAALIGADPRLGGPLVEGMPYLRAEAVHAARHEAVVHLPDLLWRRTRAGILDLAATVDAAPGAADLLGDELGWDADRRDAEVAAVADLAAAERAALASPAGAPA